MVGASSQLALEIDAAEGIASAARDVATGMRSSASLATSREPYIADIYPTVLDYLEVKAPYRLDGEVLK